MTTTDQKLGSPGLGLDDQWVYIQDKTFTNWVNEQLHVSGRSVRNLRTDLSDGVCLVALVEALQFRKIGKVFTKPSTKIQMLQNVSLALKAVTDDNVKLVNLGSEDIVNGNLKLILGLIWHLIQRYQITGRKAKVPPKKLMLMWFRTQLPEHDITNFTTDWNDGIALHALLESLKPGLSPDWQSLSPNNRVENCRRAMVLAKDHLSIPRVISPEDFASPALDELSCMTYLSYLVRSESPGYYHTLNWVCKQLRTTNITNLTTDFNDGFYMCAIVHSLGGSISDWPNIDRSKKEENCQKAINSAKSLGVDPLLSGKEMADPNVDHLSLMTYIAKLQNIKPRRSNAEKLQITGNFDSAKVGREVEFRLEKLDSDFDESKVKVEVVAGTSRQPCAAQWMGKFGKCNLTLEYSGEYAVTAFYDGTAVKGCPVEFIVKADVGQVKLLSQSTVLKMGENYSIAVDTTHGGKGEIIMESTSPTGELRYLTIVKDDNRVSGSIQPKEVGVWSICVYFGEEEVPGSPLQIRVYDPQKAWISGPENGIVGETVAFKVNHARAGDGQVTATVTHLDVIVQSEVVTSSEETNVHMIIFTPEVAGEFLVSSKFNGADIRGSPRRVGVLDPGQIVVTGEGVVHGIMGTDSSFTVNATDVGGNIAVEVEASNGKILETKWNQVGNDIYEFIYKPPIAGSYNIRVLWNGKDVNGSPFHPKITDKSKVYLMDDLTELKDENDHLALSCDKETVLNLNIGEAGPGTFSAEVLAPGGRLPVDIRYPNSDAVQLGFTAKQEGDHYIHLYWSQVPLEKSPILAYCPGPILPINHAAVVLQGPGIVSARATVPTEFLVDGKKAGPGIPRIRMQGVKSDVDVHIRAMKYDRYKCSYQAPYPGGYLLYVEWSGKQVPQSPCKVNVTNKGNGHRVKVEGQGLRGGYVGQELRAVVDTTEAGNGEVTSDCIGLRHTARCDQIDHRNGKFTLRIFPTQACKHTLTVLYDGEHVPGSPFKIPVGEPPDPRRVRVYGPGVDAGVLQTFESKFIVETYGAGAGQLAVRVRGPRGAFRVDMKRDRLEERTILCRYDPTEPGEYIVTVKWSGTHVPGSPFQVNVFDTKEKLVEHVKMVRRPELIADYQWKEEI